LEKLRAHNKGLEESILPQFLASLAQLHPAQAKVIAARVGGAWPHFVQVRSLAATAPDHPEHAIEVLPSIEGDLDSQWEFYPVARKTIQSVLKLGPEKAAELVRALHSPAHRAMLSADVVPALAKTDPAAARKFLDQAIADANTPMDDKDRIAILLALSNSCLGARR
jgi:hypothetical protein